MFEQSILKGATKTRRVWTVMASFLGQTIFIGFGILLPLIAFDRLPQVRLTPPLLAPPTPKPPDMRARPHMEVVAVIRGHAAHPFTAPPSVPSTVATIVETPEPPAESLVAQNGNTVPFWPGGSGNGVPYSPGNIGGPIVTPPPPPPPTRHDPEPVQRRQDPVRIGGLVMMAKLIHQVTPAYPPLARQARIEGTVQLQAIISRDGRIQDLRVTSGHPLLTQAAVDAVRQWVYQPTTLNGSPVEVLTTIDVNFTLKR